ncbi:MAG: glycoside hydrolase 43 family protein [Draconibacterium sp.]
MTNRIYIIMAICLLLGNSAYGQKSLKNKQAADKKENSFTNPILFADYSDPDVCRVGDDYYMTSSSFNCVPGLPILHSKDLVNWQLIGHALKKLLPEDIYNKPQHGKGVYAPCIRYHNNEFMIYYGDPDYGIFVVKTKDPHGDWGDPILVKGGKGMIDPTPLFDDDGRAYLAHAWAGSRSRINSILTLSEMNANGTKVIGPEVLIFDGLANGNHTIEGTKLYKRNGYYYILAPAGGVKYGWQLALRSKNIYGPYEYKVVLEQGSTAINGPHQGAWIETPAGESWFIHFQSRGAYGRIVHLQPVQWINDWPEMGIENKGKREPVITYQKPNIKGDFPPVTPATSDEFNSPRLGLQWQWHANPKDTWALTSNLGFLRIYATPLPVDYRNLWDLPNLLLQKFPAQQFVATTKIKLSGLKDGEKAALVVMGLDYSYLSVKPTDGGYEIAQVVCRDAEKQNSESKVEKLTFNGGHVYLKLEVLNDANCHFFYSTNGEEFLPLGETFPAKPGKWIGAKLGLFATSTSPKGNLGYIDVDWFRLNQL